MPMENETREFIKAEIEGLAQIVKKGFDGVVEGLNNVDERLDALEGRVDGLDQRVQGLNNRIDTFVDHERRITRLEDSVLS